MPAGITVEPVLLIYMLATFMQYAVFQDLVYKKVCQSRPSLTLEDCQDLSSLNNTSEMEIIQKNSSHWILISTVSLTIPSIIVCNFLGAYSDTHGRKLPLVLPSVGIILSSIVYMVMSTYPAVPIDFIILASIMSGLFGGFVSCIMAVVSYVTTISSAELRTMRVGLLESMTFVGGTIGPFIGGAIFRASNSHTFVFLAILCCHSLICFYVIFLIPEVSPPQSVGTTSKSCARYLSCEDFIGSVKTVTKKRDEHRRTIIVLLLIASFVVMTVTAGEMDVAFLYTHNYPLLWDYELYSYYFGLKYGLGALALLVVMPLARRYFVNDIILVVVSVLSKSFGLVLHGLSTNTAMMFSVAVVSMFSSLCIPVFRAQLSVLVDASEHGKLFAFVASLENLCTLFGTLMFNSLYPATLSFFSGFVFEFGAGLLAIPLILVGISVT
ncbi:proton-coupled folate transporter-like isoform X3 [Artemia franciscana]|uniref:proton-coupled folate transporter-like isoform X3 n=1 Tax=Artemia franciscana TaxID=6661 RepID=UPI0032DA5091